MSSFLSAEGKLERLILQCRLCNNEFVIHRRCYRGHVFCGAGCRKRGGRETAGAARRRYRQSDEARKDHRDAERARRAARVAELRDAQQARVRRRRQRARARARGRKAARRRSRRCRARRRARAGRRSAGRDEHSRKQSRPRCCVGDQASKKLPFLSEIDGTKEGRDAVEETRPVHLAHEAAASRIVHPVATERVGTDSCARRPDPSGDPDAVVLERMAGRACIACGGRDGPLVRMVDRRGRDHP